MRGKFAINKERYSAIASFAPAFQIEHFFILSTCNRTEIYGFADDAEQLIALLCTHTDGDADTFKKVGYVKRGVVAIDHLFNVAAGLDSQILGDYEILGQLRSAIKFAKENNLVHATLERMVNEAFQSSKAIKAQTNLSGGTTSVSFAAVKYIKENVANIADKNILILGIGKMGLNTCRNLVDYVDTTNVTLINRSPEKAANVALQLGFKYAPIAKLSACIAKASVLLVATSALQPTITQSQLIDQGDKLIIDLSIPNNVEEGVAFLKNVSLMTVDELSKQKNETLQKRKAEIPHARAIVTCHVNEFIKWYEMQKNLSVLKAVKQKLADIYQYTPFVLQKNDSTSASLIASGSSSLAIQKILNNMANKLRQENTKGCQYIEAINEYIACYNNS